MRSTRSHFTTLYPITSFLRANACSNACAADVFNVTPSRVLGPFVSLKPVTFALLLVTTFCHHVVAPTSSATRIVRFWRHIDRKLCPTSAFAVRSSWRFHQAVAAAAAAAEESTPASFRRAASSRTSLNAARCTSRIRHRRFQLSASRLALAFRIRSRSILSSCLCLFSSAPLGAYCSLPVICCTRRTLFGICVVSARRFGAFDVPSSLGWLISIYRLSHDVA